MERQQAELSAAQARLDAIPRVFRGTPAECAAHAAAFKAAKEHLEVCRRRLGVGATRAN